MQGWWRGAVIYQIYPRSYQDSNGDGIGDLNGITRRLPYIANLGVDAIWLSPVFTSPMADMGYDVSNYRDINPEFGTLADFNTLVQTAHDLGLKVMIDQVLSHSSDQHPYFQESRQSRDNDKADWYVWADPKPDGSPPNNWLAIFGGIAWQWESRRRQYYLHNFLIEQPDFNFHNPKVQAWHLDNMRFWLELGVDGFRLDTANFYFHDQQLRNDAADYRVKQEADWNPYEMQYHLFSKNQPENLPFLEKMRALLDEYDDRTIVGEIGDSHHSIDLMAQYTSGKKLHMCYSFEMLGARYDAQHFRQQLIDFYQQAPNGWPCWAFSNHDVVRHTSRWTEKASSHEALAKQAAALLLTLQGSVCLYQGEELGQTESELEYEELTDPQGINFWPENKGRDGCRTPMVWEVAQTHGGFTEGTPWLPVKAPQLANSADTQIAQANSIHECYRQLLSLRKSSDSLRTGETRFFDTQEPVLSFMRGDDHLAVFNLSADEQCLSVSGADQLTVKISEAATLDVGKLTLSGNGFMLCKIYGDFKLSDR